MDPPTLTNLTEEKRKKISEGLKLFIETELDIMTESCPNPSQPSTLYALDALVDIAQGRRYLDKDYNQKYCKRRNELMKRYSIAEGP